MECHFSIWNADGIKGTFSRPCVVDDWQGYSLFKDDKLLELSDGALGRSYVKLIKSNADESKKEFAIGNRLGEYQIALDKIDYFVCK